MANVALPQIHEDGFEIHPGIFTARAMDAAIAEIERAIPDAAGIAGYRQPAEGIPALAKLANSPELLALARSVIGPDAFVARTIFFDKNPTANWKVAWHQDLTICVERRVDIPGFHSWSVKEGVQHVQPPVSVLERMITLRLHLDDCDETNGALRVLPGAHNSGRLSPEEIREIRGRVPEFFCYLARGGVLAIRPLLLHASSAATHPRHRRVLHVEFASEELPGGLKWRTQSNRPDNRSFHRDHS